MTNDKPIAPKRRYELTLEIGADTKEELFMLLDHFQRLIEKDIRTNVSGGYGSGGSFQFDERPEQTHEKWEAELEGYLEQLRQAKSRDASGGGK